LRKSSTSFLEKTTLDLLSTQIREVYEADNRPWVIGYSGGKDSTTALQMIWYALSKLPTERRQKPVHVIASDTLVETPVIVSYIDKTLDRVNEAAARLKMPSKRRRFGPRSRIRFG